MLLSPAAASFDMFVDYAARGRAFKAAVAALAAERERRTCPMNLAPPVPRLERPAAPPGPAAVDRSKAVDRTPVKSRPGALRRERHQADYVILVVVVALTAVGILMVYSSSALQGLPLAGRGHVRDRRAADPVGHPGAHRDGGDDAGRLPLPAARVGADVRRRHRPARARLRPAAQHRGRRLGALAQARACCRPSIRPSSPSWP